MSELDIDTEIGEYAIPGESDIVNRHVDILLAHFREHYEGKGILAQRAIHAKSHGLLRGTLQVLDHGDVDLQHSIFRMPTTYDAIVRISNGDGPAGPDTDTIASIGFAIKVRGVRDEKFIPEQTEDSQDFLFLESAGVYIQGCSWIRVVDACNRWWHFPKTDMSATKFPRDPIPTARVHQG